MPRTATVARIDGSKVAAFFEGCTLTLAEDNKPVTKIEWGWATATESRVRDDIQLFFRHAKNIQIDRLTWDGERRG